MKSKIRVIGVIVLVALIGLSMASCVSAPKGGMGSVTIVGIPGQYNGKFAMLTLDTGGRGARTLAWGSRTITGTSATFNLLDWVTDQPTALSDGNYGINIIIATSMQAIADDQEEYTGIIMVMALAGETVSIEWGEFISP